VVAEIDRAGRLLEHHRRRSEQLRFRARIIGGVGRALGERHVAGRLDEALELAIRDGVPVHPEAVHGYFVGGGLLRIVTVGPHEESPTRNPDHAFGWRLARLWRAPNELAVLRRRIDLHERSPFGISSR